MKNIWVDKLHEKDVDHFTSDTGLFIRRAIDKPFKKGCNIFTGVNFVEERHEVDADSNVFKRLDQTITNKSDSKRILTDEEYFEGLEFKRIPTYSYELKEKKNNIVLERYPNLNPGEPYIFVCNHTCPEDIETILNVIDRNAYLVLGSLETATYDPEMYLCWANGVIPFDILDSDQRKLVFQKMVRVLKTNSILIFPEGSHNYSPNNIINPLFDGPVNLSLSTGRKIVVCTLLRDHKNNVSYIDVSNPVELNEFGITRDYSIADETLREKRYVNSLTACIRDKMATACYYMMVRHFDRLDRESYSDIEECLRQECVEDSFEKMKWKHDVFDAEFLVRKTPEQREYEDVIRSLSNIRYNPEVLKTTGLNTRQYVLLDRDLQRKNVAEVMRAHWLEESRKLVKKK